MGVSDIFSGTTAHDKNVLETLGATSVESGGSLFCGVSMEAFSINGVTYSWPPGSELTWGLAFSRLGQLGDMDLKDAVSEALKEISACCDVRHRYVGNSNGANLKLTIQRLDGPSGVLADFQIPVGNVSVDSTQLLGRFDDGESWVLSDNPQSGQIDFYRVVLHELQHGHGLGHKPSSVPGEALIAPIYSTRIRHLQPLDIQELVRRYGESKQPELPNTPATKDIEGTITVVIDGVKYQAAGPLKRIS